MLLTYCRNPRGPKPWGTKQHRWRRTDEVPWSKYSVFCFWLEENKSGEKSCWGEARNGGTQGLDFSEMNQKKSERIWWDGGRKGGASDLKLILTQTLHGKMIAFKERKIQRTTLWLCVLGLSPSQLATFSSHTPDRSHQLFTAIHRVFADP